MKHTKGPWQIRRGDDGYVVDAEGLMLVDRQTKADARLIAAAPELLEACKEALACIDQHTDDKVLAPIIEFARQAIAKAEGTEK